MKTLEIFRGRSKINYVCENGDIYDSYSRLVNEAGVIINESQYVNTDHTLNYKGGRLSSGFYYAISGWRQKTHVDKPTRVLRLFRVVNKNLSLIKSQNDLTEEMVTLPSDIPNPNHNGKKIITHVLCHPASINWDWSHGCLTWLNYIIAHDYDRLMSCIQDKEIIEVILYENS